MLDLLSISLRDSLNRYSANELAYYALTSKIENQIRDGLAWTLHCSLGPSGMAAREFNRIDIAVIRNGAINAVIELKSMYSFDIISESNIRNYVNEINGDHTKRACFLGVGVDFYSISIIVHPMRLISSGLKGVVKYSGGINSALRKWGEVNLKRMASDRWIQASEKSGFSVLEIDHHAGSAFEIPVSLSFYIKKKCV